MEEHPHSQKSHDACAENRLSIPIDRRLPSCGFEIQSPHRARSASRSTAPVRLIDASAEKTQAKVAGVKRQVFPHREGAMLSAENLRAALPANRVSISLCPSRRFLRAFANPAATTWPVSSETKTIDATLHRT